MWWIVIGGGKRGSIGTRIGLIMNGGRGGKGSRLRLVGGGWSEGRSGVASRIY